MSTEFEMTLNDAFSIGSAIRHPATLLDRINSKTCKNSKASLISFLKQNTEIYHISLTLKISLQKKNQRGFKCIGEWSCGVRANHYFV